MTKESAVKPEYVGQGILVLEPTYKYIILEDINRWPSGMTIEDGMFLACEGTVKNKVVARRTLSSAALGNEGLFNLSLYGSGAVALESNVPAEELIEIPKGGFTPKQFVESGWWQSVNTRDILGIDDAGAAAFAMEIEDAAKSAKGAGRKMVLLMPEDSAERVRSILAKDFNATELKKAVKNGGIIIKEGNPGRGAAGCYVARQDDMSLKTPVIILGPDWNEETLAHEFLHHLRHVDDTRDALTRSPYPFREDGERRSMRYMPESERNSLSNLRRPPRSPNPW